MWLVPLLPFHRPCLDCQSHHVPGCPANKCGGMATLLDGMAGESLTAQGRVWHGKTEPGRAEQSVARKGLGTRRQPWCFGVKSWGKEGTWPNCLASKSSGFC